MAATGTFDIDSETITDDDVSPLAAIQRVKLAQRTNDRFPVNLMDLRTWDAVGTNLPGTPGTDDLGLVTGTFGTDPVYVGTGDVKAGGCTRYARFLLPIPHDYEGNPESLTIRCIAGMKTTIADTSAAIDVEAWRVDADGTLGAADVVSTAAMTMNTLAAANRDFVLTTTTLAKGDVLDVRVKITVVDAATVTAVIAAIWQIELLADLR